MLKMARELARHGHRLQMINALLEANGFHEAYDLSRSAAYSQRIAGNR
jgi:hypothetical protein